MPDPQTPDFAAIAAEQGAARAASERAALAKLAELVGIVYRLRDPDGCPWDRAQSVDSMALNLVEEAFGLREYAPGDRLDVGPLRIRFHEVEHFVQTFAVEIVSGAGGGRFVFGADTGPSEGLVEFAAGADLLVHVIDASNPDRERQIAAVRTVLSEVGADAVPMLDVFNKCDRLDEGERGRLRAVSPGALCVSALTGDGQDDLIAAMEARLALTLPPGP